MLDTWKCEELSECPAGYRANPSNNKECQPCKDNEKTCGISGAITCMTDTLVNPAAALTAETSYKKFLLTGYPIRWCKEKTLSTNECEDGWYEDELVCK